MRAPIISDPMTTGQVGWHVARKSWPPAFGPSVFSVQCSMFMPSPNWIFGVEL